MRRGSICLRRTSCHCDLGFNFAYLVYHPGGTHTAIHSFGHRHDRFRRNLGGQQCAGRQYVGRHHHQLRTVHGALDRARECRGTGLSCIAGGQLEIGERLRDYYPPANRTRIPASRGKSRLFRGDRQFPTCRFSTAWPSSSALQPTTTPTRIPRSAITSSWTTGQLITSDDSFTGTVNVDNLVRELIVAGKTWKSYAESLPAVGYTGGDAYPYLERHNPFSYFTDVRNSSVQRQNLVPFTQFATDLANNQLPVFSYIVPNAEHDAHNCPDGTQKCADTLKLSTADTWLKSNISPLLSSSVFQKDGLLIIVFEEAAVSDSSHGGGHVAMLAVGPAVKAAYESSTFYQHQNTLRLVINSTEAAAAPGTSFGAADMSEFLR